MRVNNDFINIGIIFESDIQSGGAFQQSLSTIELISKLPKNHVNINLYRTFKTISHNSKLNNFKSKYISLNLVQKTLIFLRNNIKNLRILNLIKKIKKYNSFEKHLINDKIDIVYFLDPSPLAINLENLNYIITVWDLCHREDLEFPEVRINREFERREYKYNKILPKASYIIADSVFGKNNIEKFYSVDPKRIYTIPFRISSDLKIQTSKNNNNILIKNKICKKKYLFYPAQFWAHKNHIYILDTISNYEKIYNEGIDVVFTGGNKGNLEYIKEKIKEYDINKSKLHFLGFVENNDIVILYKEALALFMPSYFGPMNIPPLEAFYHNIPVLYSDKKNMIEIFGDSVIAINLNDSKDAAKKINKLIIDKTYYNQIVKKGSDYLLNQKDSDIISIYKTIFEDFRIRRNLWS